MTKRYDLVFSTNRFNLSQPKEYFINECCYGDDLAEWLRAELLKLGIEATKPDQEDWGWYINLQHSANSYFIGIGGNADDESSGNQGEWRLMIDKIRSLKEKLMGKNLMVENEEIVMILKRIVENEADMKLLRIE